MYFARNRTLLAEHLVGHRKRSFLRDQQTCNEIIYTLDMVDASCNCKCMQEPVTRLDSECIKIHVASHALYRNPGDVLMLQSQQPSVQRGAQV
jgi:hypothetical protein